MSPQRPDGERIVGGDEAERPRAGALQPARQQHAERLVRQPALERIGDHVEAVAARKGLDQQVAALRQHRVVRLQAQPVGDLLGQRLPALRVGEHAAHLVGEIGRQRELAAGIDRAPWRPRRARWTRSTRSRGCPRSAAPCRRTGRCRPAPASPGNTSSILPSTGPPRAAVPLARARHSARSASAPRRWCRHSAGIAGRRADGVMRHMPVLGLADAWRSARRSAAHSRRWRRNRRRGRRSARSRPA